MTRIILSTLLALTILTASADDKSIDLPRFSSRNSPIQTVESIVLSDTATILTVRNRYIPGRWIALPSTMHLTDATGKTYALRHSPDMELNKQVFMPKSGDSVVKFIFEPIDKNTKSINLIMDNPKYKNSIFDIEIQRGAIASDVSETLRGNWYAADLSGDWSFGFMPQVALYDGRMWHYKDVDPKKGTLTLVDREDNSRQITLHTKTVKGGDLMVGKSPKTMVRYSRTPKTDPFYKIPDTQNKAYNTNRMMYQHTAVVRGYINGYSPKLGFAKGVIATENILAQTSRNFLIDIAPDGSFSTTLIIAHPSELTMQINNRHIPFHIAQRDTLLMYINWDDITRVSYPSLRKGFPNNRFMGGSARYNREINEFHCSNPEQDNQIHYRTLGWAKYAEHIEQNLAQSSERIKEYLSKRTLTKNGAWYIGTIPIMNHVLNVLYYESQRKYWLDKDSTIKDRNMDIPIEFYSIVKRLPLNDPRLLTLRDYSSLINQMEYFQNIGISSKLPNFDFVDLMSGEKTDLALRQFADSLSNGLIQIQSNQDVEKYYATP